MPHVILLHWLVGSTKHTYNARYIFIFLIFWVGPITAVAVARRPNYFHSINFPRKRCVCWSEGNFFLGHYQLALVSVSLIFTQTLYLTRESQKWVIITSSGCSRRSTDRDIRLSNHRNLHHPKNNSRITQSSHYSHKNSWHFLLSSRRKKNNNKHGQVHNAKLPPETAFNFYTNFDTKVAQSKRCFKQLI